MCSARDAAGHRGRYGGGQLDWSADDWTLSIDGIPPILTHHTHHHNAPDTVDAKELRHLKIERESKPDSGGLGEGTAGPSIATSARR